MGDLEDKVKVVISKQLGIDVNLITGSTGPGDFVEWDSLGHLHVILALEKEFDRKLTDKELYEIENVDGLVKAFTVEKNK